MAIIAGLVVALAGCGGIDVTESGSSATATPEPADVADDLYQTWWIDNGVVSMVVDGSANANPIYATCSTAAPSTLSGTLCDQAIESLSEMAGLILDDISASGLPMTNVVEDLESVKSSAQQWAAQSCLLTIINTYDLAGQIGCQTAFVNARTGLLSAMITIRDMAGR